MFVLTVFKNIFSKSFILASKYYLPIMHIQSVSSYYDLRQ